MGDLHMYEVTSFVVFKSIEMETKSQFITF